MVYQELRRSEESRSHFVTKSESPKVSYDCQVEDILKDPELDDLDKMLAIQDIQKEQKSNIDGYWDGIIGESPKYPEDFDYWEGWALGAREYWLKELNRAVEMEM